APRSSIALGLVGSRWRSPRFSRFDSWAWTLELEVSPTASPISRTVGGYPRSCTVFLMKSRIRRCLAVISSMGLLRLQTLAWREGQSKHVFDPSLTPNVRSGIIARMDRTRVRWGRPGATAGVASLVVTLLMGAAGADSGARSP